MSHSTRASVNTHPQSASPIRINHHRPRRSSSPSLSFRETQANVNFDLGLPLASTASSSSRGNSRPLTGDPVVRATNLFLSSFKMATTRRGNRYLVGAALTVGTFLLYHALGGEHGGVNVNVGGLGWTPMARELGSRVNPHSAEVDSSAFIYVDDETMPETVFVKGVAGFSYFQNLYLVNGTFIAFTSDPSAIPNVDFIMSSAPEDDGNTFKPAKEDRWRVAIKGEENMQALLGSVAVRKGGVSMFFNDMQGKKNVSFLKHYFHFIGEVFLGGWRVLASAGEHSLPTRLMYRTTPDDWRDRAGLTTWFQQSIMPNTAVEESPVWEDRAKSGMSFVFDKITISDRWTAHRKGINPWRFNKMTGDLPLLEVSKSWMEPLRQTMKTLVQTKGCSVYRQKSDVPVVLYINRQLTGRRLIGEDADALGKEMQKLDEEGVIEWVDAQMETKSRVDQFCMALRADIIMGVHGNGLSHALWMKPGSAVLEFMMPGGFAKDYAMIAELMSHDYYSIHKDEIFTSDKWLKEDGWGVGTVEGFHGNSIPLSGKFISDLIRKIAAEKKGMVEP